MRLAVDDIADRKSSVQRLGSACYATAGLTLVGWLLLQTVVVASETTSQPQAPESNPSVTNPHGDLVFRATKTTSCTDCHRVDQAKGGRFLLLNNAAVKDLIAKGKGAHSGGRFADCFRCHAGGRKGVENY